VIKPAEDDGTVQGEEYKFTTAVEVHHRELRSNCDLVGIVVDPGRLREMQVKKTETTTKQTVRVRDDTGEINVCMWGHVPDLEVLRRGLVVIIIDLTVSEYKGGRRLNNKASTRIFTDLPSNSDRCNKVLAFAAQNPLLPLRALPGSKPVPVLLHSIRQCRRLVARAAEEASSHTFYSVRGFITGFSSSFCYDKCPNDNCFKKAIVDYGKPHCCECPSCGPVDKAPVSRFIGHIRIADHTSVLFVNYSTQAVGLALFGCSLEQMKQMRCSSYDAFFQHVSSRLGKLMVFRLFAKKEAADSSSKVRYHLVGVHDDEQPDRCLQTIASLIHTCLLYKPSK
jgi:hypothetical protein